MAAIQFFTLFSNTSTYIQVSKSDAPGENGKAHKLTVEQKLEEENQKGVYGFNQVTFFNTFSNLNLFCISWFMGYFPMVSWVISLQGFEGNTSPQLNRSIKWFTE